MENGTAVSERLRVRLREARRIQDVTTEDLVDRMAMVSDCRLPRNAITKFETGNGKARLTIDEVVAICQVLHLELAAFVDPDEDRWKAALREMI